MRRKVLEELRQGTSLLLEQQVFLNLVRTADQILTSAVPLLKRHGLSEPQYNVLRILRGAGEDGLPCGGIGRRMLTRGPDVTRLVDRLESAGLATRARGAEADRRRVVVRITDQGQELLAALDEPVRQFHRQQFRNLSRADLRELKRILVKLRGAEAADADEAPGV